MSDERGTIAVTFGFVLIILCLFSGIAVDVSRAYGVSAFVSGALDSTALAVARELQLRDMTDAEVRTYANTRYNALLANRNGSGVTFDPLDITVNRADETVLVTSTSVVPTYFAGLAGTDTLNVRETSTVSYKVRVVELALMLDVTGSMRGSKIDGLKVAATELVTQLIPESPGVKSNRIALAPYAASVNLGSLSVNVLPNGVASADGCVVGRLGAEAASDAAPGPGRWLTAMPAGAPLPDIDPTEGLRPTAYSCPDVEVLPLSSARGALTNRINGFSAAGWTAGHLGAAWGWYLVSPKWGQIFGNGSVPAPDTDDDTIKAVLFMTDGNFNTRYVGANGDTSNDQARDICTNMKIDGVTVYAVAFEAPAAAEATLRACATSDRHYYSADNSAELLQAFSDIAGNLTSMRLTQ